MTTDHNEALRPNMNDRSEREFMGRMESNHAKLTEFSQVVDSFTQDYQRLYATYTSYRDMLREVTAEGYTLRAEVERLRVDAERWHAANLTAETAWKHPDHRSPEENTAFSAYRCAVEDGLNFEGAVDAAVAAIDNARKATP